MQSIVPHYLPGASDQASLSLNGLALQTDKLTMYMFPLCLLFHYVVRCYMVLYF